MGAIDRGGHAVRAAVADSCRGSTAKPRDVSACALRPSLGLRGRGHDSSPSKRRSTAHRTLWSH